jgi:hypothetical protein
MTWLARWCARRGCVPLPPQSIQHAYQRLFASPDGQVVMQHLLDNIFCTVYEGSEPDGAVIHNARRAVVLEILQNSTIVTPATTEAS